MPEPIATLAQAQDAVDQLGRDSLSPDARRELSHTLASYLAQTEGRQVMQGLLGRTVDLLARVETRMESGEPMMTQLHALLEEQVAILRRAQAQAEGRARDGSRLMEIAASKPALLVYAAIAAAISGWVGTQTGAAPQTAMGAPVAEESPS